MRSPDPNIAYDSKARARETGLRSAWIWILVALLISLVSWQLMEMAGLPGLMTAAGVLTFAVVFMVLSFNQIIVPVLFWLVSLLGFRSLLMLHTQGLPDISPDRVLLVWIISIFLLKYAMGSRPTARWEALDTLLAVHLLYLLGSIIVHDNTGFNSWTRAYLMGYAAYFIGKYVINGRREMIRILIWLLLVLNIYYGVVSVAEYFKFHPLIWPKMVLDPDTYRQWPGRSHGVFLQPAVYGIIMGMLLPFQVYYLRAARNPVIKTLLYLSLPVVLAGLYFTYTRGSWLVGIFSLMTMAIVGWRRYLPLIGRLVIAGAILSAAGLINVQQDKQFVERMGTEHTVTGRVGTMTRAYRIFMDYPLFGCGYFRYNFIKRDYQGTIEVPIFGVIRRSEDIGASIHDMYLGSLAEEGLVGASLHIAIYLQILLLFRRKYRLRRHGDRFAIELMPAIAGLMVGYLVGGLAIDYRFFESLLAPFFLMAGLVAGYMPQVVVSPAEPDAPSLRLVGLHDPPPSSGR